MELCISLELSKGCQASGRLQVGNLGFFNRIGRGDRPCCEGILGVPLQSVQQNQELSGAEGELGVLFPCSKIRGVPLEIQEVTQA